MSESGGQLAAILSAWLTLERTGKPDELARLLDEQVTWRGVLPGQVCRTRAAVLDMFVHHRASVLRLTRIEAQEDVDRVAISVEGPDFEETDTHRAADPRSLVFTFDNARVVLIESFLSPSDAFARLAR